MKFDLTGQADRASLTIVTAPGWGAGGVDVGGDMGGQAGRIGWGSTCAAAQHALPVLDLTADGARGGKIAEAGIEAVEIQDRVFPFI